MTDTHVHQWVMQTPPSIASAPVADGWTAVIEWRCSDRSCRAVDQSTRQFTPEFAEVLGWTVDGDTATAPSLSDQQRIFEGTHP